MTDRREEIVLIEDSKAWLDIYPMLFARKGYSLKLICPTYEEARAFVESMEATPAALEDKVIVLLDNNLISTETGSEIASGQEFCTRLRACGVFVINVSGGGYYRDADAKVSKFDDVNDVFPIIQQYLEG